MVRPPRPLVVAFDALGVTAVSNVLHELLMWLPNLVVALAVLVSGGLAAHAVGNLVRGATATAQLGNPDFFGSIASAAIWAFAIIRIASSAEAVAERTGARSSFEGTRRRNETITGT